MFKNYLKIAFRILKKYKAYALINILGLSIGIASSLLILLFILDETITDGFHMNRDRICRVIIARQRDGNTIRSAISPAPLAEALKNELVREATEFSRGELGFDDLTMVVLKVLTSPEPANGS